MASVRISVDVTRSPMVSTGRVHPVAVFADGRPVEGQQERDKNTGFPLWSVDCLIDGDDTQRSEAVGVRVPSPVQPVVAKYQPVPFVGLVVTVRNSKTGGGLVSYWNADDIASAAARSGRNEAAA